MVNFDKHIIASPVCKWCKQFCTLYDGHLPDFWLTHLDAPIGPSEFDLLRALQVTTLPHVRVNGVVYEGVAAFKWANAAFCCCKTEGGMLEGGGTDVNTVISQLVFRARVMPKILANTIAKPNPKPNREILNTCLEYADP